MLCVALDFSGHDIFVGYLHLPSARGETLPACRKKYVWDILNYLRHISKYLRDIFSALFAGMKKTPDKNVRWQGYRFSLHGLFADSMSGIAEKIIPQRNGTAG